MADGNFNTGDRIKLVGPDREDRLLSCTINAVQSQIKKNHPKISGLFNDEELRLLTHVDTEKRFDCNSRIIQIFNTDYISLGRHWCTIVKEPEKMYQIWDSNIKVLDYLPYQVQVKLLSLSKASQRSISVEGANWKPLKSFDRVSPPICHECELNIKSYEKEVFLCCVCYSVYHERCRRITFHKDIWPMCGNCDKGKFEFDPSNKLHIEPKDTENQPRYLDELANKYFTSNHSTNQTTYFNSYNDTNAAEHPYLLIDYKDNPIKLYDCSATHYSGIYSLSHDIEVALVHLSWPHLDKCQEMEILPALQQIEENDCGVYASSYACYFASGQTTYLLRHKSSMEMRQGIQDYVNKGTTIFEPSKKIELDLSCKATRCFMTGNGQVYPKEVDIYKCYFCKNWFHVGCSPCHLLNSIYRRRCSDCNDIWNLQLGTAHTDESSSDTQHNQETDTTSSDMAGSLGDVSTVFTATSLNDENEEETQPSVFLD